MTRLHRLTAIVGCLALGLYGFDAAAQGDEETTSVRAPAEGIEEITVTGSYLRGADVEGALPVEIIDRTEIVRIGAPTINELIDRLPGNTGVEFRSDAYRGTGGGTSQVNLRGLGLGTTLVLLDGKRSVISGNVANDGSGFVDIMSYPKIIIESVDVLKEGAASTYGSDAVAGVVNFRTRRDFEGFELRTNYLDTAESTGLRNNNYEALWGWADDSTNLMLAGSFFQQDKVPGNQRSFTTPFDPTFGMSVFSNPGAFIPWWTSEVPPYSFFPAGVPITDPDCEEAGGIVFPYGAGGALGLCGYTHSEYYDLANKTKRYNGFARLERDLSDTLNVGLDFFYYRMEVDKIGYSPSFPVLRYKAVPASNPGNIFGVPATYLGRPFGHSNPDQEGDIDDTQYRSVLSLKGAFAEAIPLLGDRGWDWDASYVWSRAVRAGSAPDIIDDRFGAALQGFGGPDCTGEVPGENGCLYFNPFGSAKLNPEGTGVGGFPLGNSPDVIGWMWGKLHTETTTELQTIDGLMKGDLFEGPAGPVRLAIGTQWRWDKRAVSRNPEQDIDGPYNADREYYVFTAGGNMYDADQDVWSIFAETIVPLHDSFDVTLAARFEDYGGSVGHTLDPKISMRWQPSDWLILRSSASTTFRAPLLNQLNGIATSLQSLTDRQVIRDPYDEGFVVKGDSGYRAADVTGNPDLQTEEAVTFNAGFIVKPIEGLQIGLDYYRIRFDDIIGREVPQAIINYENDINIAKGAMFDDPHCAPDQDPGTPGCFYADPRITRLDSGIFQRVEASFINASSVVTDGIDLSVNYDFAVGSLGDVRLSARLAHIIQYQIKGGSESPFKGDAAGSANLENLARPLPKFRGDVTLGWTGDRDTAYVTMRHISPYESDDTRFNSTWGTRPSAYGEKIHAMTTWDIGYSRNVSDDLTVRLNAYNIFDQDPPFMWNDLNYDSRVHDPWGRKFLASMEYRWGE